MSISSIPSVTNVPRSHEKTASEQMPNTVRTEVPASNALSNDLIGVHQEITLSDAVLKQINTELAFGNLSSEVAVLFGMDAFNDGMNQGKQVGLMALWPDIVRTLHEEAGADSIDDQYSNFPQTKNASQAPLTNNDAKALLAKIEDWSNSQTYRNQANSTFSSVSTKNSAQQSITNLLDIQKLALLLDVSEALPSPKDHEFAQKYFLQRTYLEWVQLMYFSLLPTTAYKKHPFKEAKRKLSSKQQETAQAEEPELEQE